MLNLRSPAAQAAVRMRSPPPASTPPAKPARDYLSYSAITTYQRCPLSYYFKYIAGLPEKTVSSSLVFGSAVHRAVEHHFNELMAGNEPPTLDALTGEYDRHWQEAVPQAVQFGKGDDLESLGQLASKMFGASKRARWRRRTARSSASKKSFAETSSPAVRTCWDAST